MLRFAAVPAKCLHASTLSLDAISPRFQLPGQVVVGFVQRVLLMAGQGEVQLAVGERVLRQVKQVLFHPLRIDRMDDVADARLDRAVPGSLPVRLLPRILAFPRTQRWLPARLAGRKANNAIAAIFVNLMECPSLAVVVIRRTQTVNVIADPRRPVGLLPGHSPSSHQ